MGTKYGHLGLCLPNYLLILLRAPSYMYIFEEAFIVLGINTTSYMTPTFSVSLSIPSFIPLSRSPAHLILLFQYHPHLSIFILYSFIEEIYLCPLILCSIPKLYFYRNPAVSSSADFLPGFCQVARPHKLYNFIYLSENL